METIEIKKGIQVGFDDLAQSLSKLNNTDLAVFFKKLNAALTGHTPLHPSEEEALLLKQIKDLVPSSVIRRLKMLQTKQRNNILTEKEHKEMLLIIDFIEAKSIEKVELLASLAQIKQVPVADLARQLRSL